MSLIDRHALLKKVYEHPQERERMTDGEWCRKCIYEAPEVEAEPVRHGRWIEKPPYADETVKGLEFQIVCSRCDEQNSSITFDENSVPIAKTFYRTRYCPNCGARMDATDTNVGGKGGEQEWTTDETS